MASTMPAHNSDAHIKPGGPSFLRSRALRVDILTTFVGLLLATVLVLAGFTHHFNRQAIINLSDDLIAQTAGVALEKTAAYLEPAATAAQICASVTGETLAASGDLTALESYAIQVVTSYPQFAMINIGDEHGNFLMPKRLPDGTVATKIIRRTDDPPTVTWRYRDATGRVVRSETTTEIDYDPRVRAWYTGAKQSGARHWTDPKRAHTKGYVHQKGYADWTWYRIGDLELAAGEHRLTLSAGSGACFDALVLLPQDPVMDRAAMNLFQNWNYAPWDNPL